MTSWLEAAQETAWIPPAFARYDLSLSDAALQLRAPVDIVERLVDSGMPSAGRPIPSVDANDVFNLALNLRLHAALPTTAFRGALRWLRQPVAALVQPQDWHCEFTGPLPPAGSVRMARPAPETYGGRWRPGRQIIGSASGSGRIALPSGRTLTGVATLRGRQRPVRSGVVRETVREILDSGHRWAKLPLALQTRPEIVSSLGYATCVSISLSLSGVLRAAGFEARTRRGFLAAPVATGHSWVEVLDDDGEWKVIDPVLVLLHRRLNDLEPAGHGSPTPVAVPEQVLADGLLVNRVLASPLPAEAPLAVGADGVAVEMAAAFRKADMVRNEPHRPGDRVAVTPRRRSDQ